MFNHIHHEFPTIKRFTNENGNRLYRTPSGKAYPSVTTITGQLAKKAIQEWRERIGKEKAAAITAKASKQGTRVHHLCEDYLSNKEFRKKEFDLEMWQSIKPELDCIDNIHGLESKLFSDHLEVAGTVDCVGEYKGKLSVIDFKTSSKFKTKEQIKNYFMQTAAYAVAFEERTKVPVSNLLIIMAVAHEGCVVFEEKRDTWIDEFIDLRETYRENYGC
ncbi:PD-(D/E)XK nuclease family protein [Marinobacter sp.]|uniref:PD-(D/E)XK nuclease family protein n=1 Tax=Marinobacter sp. TaxID=50741 RepID=UPI00257E5BCB|nr:PD-(D/E)XK nuclease family protein [Marinobacter sp.]